MMSNARASSPRTNARPARPSRSADDSAAPLSGRARTRHRNATTALPRRPRSRSTRDAPHPADEPEVGRREGDWPQSRRRLTRLERFCCMGSPPTLAGALPTAPASYTGANGGIWRPRQETNSTPRSGPQRSEDTRSGGRAKSGALTIESRILQIGFLTRGCKGRSYGGCGKRASLHSPRFQSLLIAERCQYTTAMTTRKEQERCPDTLGCDCTGGLVQVRWRHCS